MKKQLILALLFLRTLSFGQINVDSVKAVGITIFNVSTMVIPFVKEGEDMRTVYEADQSAHMRVAIAGVKEGLSKQHLNTIDFRAYLKQLNNQTAANSDQQTSLKLRLIQLSATDYYIEVETQYIETDLGNSVSIILTAYDATTGISFVNRIGHSPKFYTQNVEKLTGKALDDCLDQFISDLIDSFDDQRKNGRSIALEIGITNDSEIDMDSEIDDTGRLLSEIIEEWLENNTYKSYFHIQGLTATKLIVDELRIPLKEKGTNKIYSPTRFAKELRLFLTDLNLDVTRDIRGGRIILALSDK